MDPTKGQPPPPEPTPVRAVPPEFQAFTEAFPRHTRRKIEALCRKAKRAGKTVRIFRDGRCEIVDKPTTNVMHVARGLGSVPGADGET